MKAFFLDTAGIRSSVGALCCAGALLLASSVVAHGQAAIHRNISQGVKGSGFGRDAIKDFNVRDNNELDTSLPDVGLGDAAQKAKAGMGAALDMLKPGGDGRIQMFNVARLTEAELANPFEIRVQVRVDVREIELTVGGIVEGEGARPTTALLLIKPAVTVTKEQIKAREKAQAQGRRGATAPPQNQGKKYLCSAGDQVEGFRIHEIFRDHVVLEMMGNYLEVSRGQPVTICVPLSSIN